MSIFVVGLGGTTRVGSSTERLVQASLDAASARGAETEMFGGEALDLPMYAPELPERTEKAQHLVASLRRADGIIVGSPGYHGTLSGLVKNALDYVEDMANDEVTYLDGRAVGTIANAYGWSAVYGTMGALRSVVHALRGWPTPMGAGINTSLTVFGSDGAIVDERSRVQLELVGHQVVDFAEMRFAAQRTP